MSFIHMSPQERSNYFEEICSKRYDSLLVGERAEPPTPIASILSDNADMEPYIIQSSAVRTPFLEVCHDTLQFVHFSDVHAMVELWSRITEFINHYSTTVTFGLHTGDYCCAYQAQFHDCYAEGLPCTRPVLNCVGNHDTVDEQGQPLSKKTTFDKLFRHADRWDVSFFELPYSMAYYKDFPDSNVRLIVLDQYYDIEPQISQLSTLLEEARLKDLHVITAAHQPTAPITEKIDVTFQTITPYVESDPDLFDEAIAAFKENGGVHICHLCGHYHSDWFGRTARGVLNIAVESATDWAGWCDGKRERGTRTYDSFNVVTVDTSLGLLKLVRIGNQTDLYLRSKKTLCYNYIHKTIISNT